MSVLNLNFTGMFCWIIWHFFVIIEKILIYMSVLHLNFIGMFYWLYEISFEFYLYITLNYEIL